MEKILMYPYNRAYRTYVMNEVVDGNKKIESIVSPRGWGFEGETVKCSNRQYIITSEFSEEMKKCSIVWFVEDDNLKLPDNTLLEKVKEAINGGKKIIYTRYKDGEMYLKVSKMLDETKSQIEIIDEKMDDIISFKDYCYEIRVPVITIIGLEERTEKFDVEVALWNRFRQLGYDVEAISTRLDSNIIGIHPIPRFMFEVGMTETEKIIKYNHFIKKIEIAKKPEVIIVAIPGAIMPFDRVNHSNFGSMAFLISMAISSDSSILCSPLYNKTTMDYTEIKEDIFNKFGFEIDYCYIAPITVDGRSLHEDYERKLFEIGSEHVSEALENINQNAISNILIGNNIDEIVEVIIEKLG